MIWLWRKDSNLRMAALTVRCFTSLATPQENWLRRRDSNSYHLVYKTSALKPIELRRNLVDWEGFKPSQEVCRTSMLSVTSPAPVRVWSLGVLESGLRTPDSRLRTLNLVA